MELHRERVEELFEAFKIFSEQGYMAEEHVINALRLIGFNPTQRSVEEAILELDKKKPGNISFDNFINLCTQEWGELPSGDLLKEAFRVFDIQNCGVISRKELVKILVGTGTECIPPQDAEWFISRLSTKDDMVNYADVIELINQI